MASKASEALTAYAAYSPTQRAYRASTGHWATTGVLSQARLWRAPELAQAAIDMLTGGDWVVVPVCSLIPEE